MLSERRTGAVVQNFLLSVITLLLGITGFFSMKYYDNMEKFVQDAQLKYAAHEIRLDGVEGRVGVLEYKIDGKSTGGN